MAAAATPENSDCTKQKQLRIAKLKLPTLAGGNNKRHRDSWPIHFDLRSEADNAPPLLAALFSNEIFRIRGASQCIRLQKPGFLTNNPSLSLFTGLFSEIKEGLALEARNFSIIQSEYFVECIKRSRSPAIYRTINSPETANAASQLRNNLSFLVRFFLEFMEGPEHFKAASSMPWLPDIYSTKKSKGACEMPSLLDSSVRQDREASVYKSSPTSGFNSLFTGKRK